MSSFELVPYECAHAQTHRRTLEEIHSRLLVSTSNQSRLRSSDLQRSFFTELSTLSFYFQVSFLKMLQKTDGTT
jgi:hypothetical protein